MKKFVIIAILAIIIGGNIANMAKNAEKTQVQAQQAPNLDTPERRAKIKVKFEVQDIIEGKQKIVANVKNDSDKKFSGSMFVSVKNSLGEQVYWDYIYPENVEPGKNTFAILWVPICDGYKVSHNMDYKFQ